MPLGGPQHVALAFVPEAPPARLDRDGPFPEIPAAPSLADELRSTLDVLLARIVALPLEAMVDEATLTYSWSEDFLEWEYDYQITVETPVVLGLGLHFGPFDADLVFNDTTPFGLGYLLTGGQDGQDTGFSSITLGYRF